MAKAKVLAVKDYMDAEIFEYDIPEPMEDGLLIKVEAAAVCGSDLHTAAAKGRKREYPGGIGHEFAGKIVAMGKRANETIKSFNGELHIGDRIAVYPWITCGHCRPCLKFGPGVCTACEDAYIYGGDSQNVNEILNDNPANWPHFKGGFAEYVHIFSGTYVWKIPDEMPSEIAALLDPMAVAMRAVEQGAGPLNGLREGINTNSRVVVVGPGPIGIMTAMILKRMGVQQLVMTGRSDGKLKRAQEICGADVIINVKGMTEDEQVKSVLDATDGGGDLVINCANNLESVKTALQMTDLMGTYVEVGNAGPWSTEEATVKVTALWGKNQNITGVCVNTAQTFDRAFRLLKKYKEIPFDKLITHKFHTLEDFIPTVEHGRDEDYIKGVLIFEE